MRLRFSIALMAIVAAMSAYAVQRTWKEIERFRYDWRRNGSPLTFIIERASDHDWGGEADRLRIRLPNRPDFIVQDLDGLDTYANAMHLQPAAMRMAKRNRAASKFALFVPVAQGRELLLLTGWAYGSSPGSLHVIAFDADGYPHEILYVNELALVDLVDLDGDGSSELVGRPCLSQCWDEQGDHCSYDPLHVFKLPLNGSGKAQLSLSLSKRYNLSHGYVWAGPECSESLEVIKKGGKLTVRPHKE